VQRAFRLRFNIQPPNKKSICRWNHQFEQIGCLCKGKSSGQPRVSEEKVRRIQESFERGPRKWTRRASRELGIPQPTVWRVLRRRLLFNWVHLFESPCVSVHWYIYNQVTLRIHVSTINGHLQANKEHFYCTLIMLYCTLKCFLFACKWPFTVETCSRNVTWLYILYHCTDILLCTDGI